MIKLLLRLFDNSVECKTHFQKITYVTLRKLLPMFVKGYEFTDIHGNRYNIRNISSVIERNLILNGFWEKQTTDWIKTYLKANQVFWDIGAHIGYDAQLAAKIVGNTGQVIAFEPNPFVAKELKENIRLNRFSNIKVYENCVSADSEKKVIPLFIPNSKVAHTGMSSLLKTENSFAVECQAVYLPDLVDKQEIALPNFIKMDVEGYELQVIKSIEGILKNMKNPMYIILEVRKPVGEVSDVETLLATYNFKIADRTKPQPQSREVSMQMGNPTIEYEEFDAIFSNR